MCPTAPQPWRIEFWDNEVDSIREFAPDTQRTVDKQREILFAPASECVFTASQRQEIIAGLRRESEKKPAAAKGKRRAETAPAAPGPDAAPLSPAAGRAAQLAELLSEGCFFPGHEQLLPYTGLPPALIADYFSSPALPVLAEPSRQRESSLLWEREYHETCLALLEKGRICPGQMRAFLTLDELIRPLAKNGLLFLALLPKRPSWFEQINTLGITSKSVSLFLKKAQLLADEVREWRRQQYCVMIVVDSQERGRRLQEGLRSAGVESGWLAGDFRPVAGGVFLLPGRISGGFDLPVLRLAVISEYELYFQPKKKQVKKIFREGKKRVFLEDLKPGDYVVHVNYGIGRYEGIENITVELSQRDYLVISYSGSDRLYVPTDQAELLQKYTGQEGSHPKLSRLGGSEWHKVKAKARKVVDGMADDLLDLYAAREALPGTNFGADTVWQKEFEEAFPFEETPDQLRSIEEVKADMERSRPMDRLLCGDVGYGKTEVAMRAAFKAAAAGRQVAILVPTTVLAQQHYNTFRERFEGFAMEVAVLNRFRRPAEQKEILRRLALGRVDILIGTHRILSKDVQFKNLGLLVVDEDQRFGVGHKERIKQLKKTVDVLTLTATPIPRTLHMAMTGLRDLSVIETAPEDRYPVQTYVVEYSPPLIREAIRRELGRGGQVYYVHNRIEDIDRVGETVSALVPEARVSVAHGRMTEAALERVMFDFMEGDVDVLVCTTIIESGLDISNANTAIITSADRLGLAQLYQIRGRIGRSNRVAYAYLTYMKEKTISEVAEKRMSAIREFTDLGAGYKIAMRDMEIRGAGNLLGAEQHGQISAVGFDLYCRMLEDAVKRKQKERAAGQALPGQPEDELETVSIDLQISAYIPAEYMADESAKIDFYQRINHAGNEEDIADLREEMVDRFGDLPGPLENLLVIGLLKALAKDAKIAMIAQEAGRIRIVMAPDHGLKGPALMELVKSFNRRISFSAAEKLEITIQLAKLEEQDVIGFLMKVVRALLALVKPA
jgi:transcription-repair coupling factor (superfamily II helicase)